MQHLLTPDVQTLMATLLPDQTWLVGGAVRDFLQDGTLSDDVDLATQATPATVQQKLAAAGIFCIPTGLAYGTVTARLRGRSYEITTLREDISTDGRKAGVTFTRDLQTDAARRDFTCNALYLDNAGVLSDFYGGVDDLKHGIIRFIGDPAARLLEDHLRLLRLFRFAGKLGVQTLTPEIMEVITAKRGLLTKLSPERITSEMLKIARLPTPPWRLMAMCHIFDTLTLPNPKPLTGLPARAPHLTLASCFLPAPTVLINRYFSWSKNQKRDFKALEAGYAADYTPTQNSYRYGYDIAQLLSAARGLAPPPKVPPAFPVTAAMLMARGFTPGKVLGDTLTSLEQWWFENHFPSEKEVLAQLSR